MFVDGVGRLDFKGDGLAGQRLHEDLQTEKLYAMRSNTTLMPDGLFFTLCVVEHDDGSLLLSVVLRCTRRQKWQKLLRYNFGNLTFVVLQTLIASLEKRNKNLTSCRHLHATTWHFYFPSYSLCSESSSLISAS